MTTKTTRTSMMQTPRKQHRGPSDNFQVRIRWLIYLFLSMNILFIFYVYNVASSCSASTGSQHKGLAAMAALPTVRSSEKATNTGGGDETSFTQWLVDNSDTPGARLVTLLRTHLHTHPEAEGERLQGCRDKNYPLCFGGHGQYKAAIEAAPADKKEDMLYLEKVTKMPFHDDYSVWNMRRFAQMGNDKLRIIHNLGTEPACLALLLAGVAVADFGVVVELGTYLGLSSKCIGLGLNVTKQEDAYYAFDLFGNDEFNYDKITSAMPWTTHIMPDFKKESSYLWLWRNATVDAYPGAQAFEGMINATTLYPRLWHKKPIALMSIDSAKTWASFRDQTAGIQKPYMLKKGAILILMDFITIDTQIKLFLTGCMGQYLQPVYSSFCKGEQWIFVATQTFSLGMVGACMQDYLGDQKEPTEDQYNVMLQRAQQHVDFMDGLDGHSMSQSMEGERTCMMEHLTKELKESTLHWTYIRRS